MFDLIRLGGQRNGFRPHRYLVHERQARDCVHRIQEGWAAECRTLPDGRRQITALYLPGDFCGLSSLQDADVDRAVIALSPVNSISLSREALLTACAQDSDLRSAIWQEIFASGARQSEWIVNLGRKRAIERISHLFCELYERLHAVGMTVGPQCAMPLTQVDLADITGLTPVHVNRTLQDMRARRLIDLHSKWLHILQFDALRATALYHGAQRKGRPYALVA